MKNFIFRKPITYNKLKQEPGVSKGMVLVLSTEDQPLEDQLLVDQLSINRRHVTQHFPLHSKVIHQIIL